VSHLRETVHNWAATGATVGGVFAALFTYDVIQRLAFRFGIHAQQRAASHMAWAINRAARLAGTRFRFEGTEHVEPKRPYIIVSNHQSLLDISMASEFLAPLEPRYVSKVELGQGIPGVSYNLRRGGSALIDRKNPEQAHAAIERLSRRIVDEGFSVLIFPEGTRSRTGAMRPFREAGLRTLVLNAPGVPVLPVTTSGGSRLFRNQLKPILRDVELVFRVHPPMMPPDARDPEAFSAFVRVCEETIQSALPEVDKRGRALG
jgi:1-acyl-sn-glycerol-3-phosphate acyltransferase